MAADATLAATSMQAPKPIHLGADATAATPNDAPPALHALLIDVEPAAAELIAFWSAAEGWPLHTELQSGDRVDLIVIELAFPRQADRQRLLALTEVWPDVPVIVLSPTIFADTPAHGEVARQLGVPAVLAMPLRRVALLAAVGSILGAPP